MAKDEQNWEEIVKIAEQVDAQQNQKIAQALKEIQCQKPKIMMPQAEVIFKRTKKAPQIETVMSAADA